MARFAEWQLRCLLRLPRVVAFDSYGVRFFCPAERRGQAKLAFVFRESFEPELAALRSLVSQGDSVVDAGAHYGAYTVVLGKLVGPSGSVLAVEPGSHAMGILRRNVELNHLSNVELVHAALGSEPGAAALRLHPDSSRNQVINEPTSGAAEHVRVATLDGLVVHRPVRFVKIDVEGSEAAVLSGAVGILASDRPVVLFEHNPFAASEVGQSTVAAWKLMQDLGYDMFRMTYESMERVPAGPPDAVVNVLAITSDHQPLSTK